MIPGNERSSGNLPPGVHRASLDDLRRRFATGPRRKEIFRALEWVVQELLARGVRDIWIDGSFITTKRRPGDVDVIFDAPLGYGPSWGMLHISQRDQLWKRRRVDLLTVNCGESHLVTGAWIPILDYFQEDRDGRRKGIVKLATI